MISVIKGDIFNSDAPVLVNTVNCVGVMGKGLALSMKNRYPAMFREYRRACNAREIEPGTIWIWADEGEKTILNAAVKDHWRQASRYEWIRSCMDEIIEFMHDNNLSKVAMTWMGAYNGWLEPARIETIIREKLADVSFDVEIYTL